MSLWWLQPGWTDGCCANCGQKIWPEGDPDWGMCYECFTEHLNSQSAQNIMSEAQERVEFVDAMNEINPGADNGEP